MTGSFMIRLRQGNEHIFEDRRNGAQFIHMTTIVLDLRCQPAEDILSLDLSHTDMQPVTKCLDVFHIPILTRHVPEKTNRRAAQFQDTMIEACSQVRRRVFRDDFSILHESHTVTPRSFIHIGCRDNDTYSSLSVCREVD